MRVQDAMTKTPATCRPDTNLAIAAELMWTHDCGSLPVLDDAEAVGFVTDRDMLIALGTRKQRPADLTVAEVMRSPVITCTPTDDVTLALSTMRGRKVRRLPVVDRDGKLMGILAINDLVLHSDRHGRKETAVPYDEVMTALKGICDYHQIMTTQEHRADERLEVELAPGVGHAL